VSAASKMTGIPETAVSEWLDAELDLLQKRKADSDQESSPSQESKGKEREQESVLVGPDMTR